MFIASSPVTGIIQGLTRSIIGGLGANPPVLRYNFAVDKSLVAVIGPTLGITRVSDATYFDSAGVLQTASGGVARFDHDPATLDSLGLLAEDERTNLCLWNRDFTNAAWVKSNMTAAKDETGEDDAANAASSLLATAANATVLQSFTIASAVKDTSFSLKRLTGTGNINITLDNGATWTTKVLTSSWQRFDVSATLANPVIGIRIVVDTDKIAVDFAGLEVASFPTSRIPTTSATVTRNADRIFLQNNADIIELWNNNAGTMFASGTRPAVGTALHMMFEASDRGSNNSFEMSSETNVDVPKIQRTDASFVFTPVGHDWDGNFKRLVLAWDGTTDAVGYIDGTQIGTDSAYTLPTEVDSIYVGTRRTTTDWFFNGHIAEIRYYNTRQSNQFLEDLSNGLV